MFDIKGRFIIENYAMKSTFSSFLPGISGKFGIPIWCFYVNRGQGVTSFGVEDKEHSIMEFYPAHQAYQSTKTLGFRTFLKVEGTYYEPFSDEMLPKKMYIGMNEFEVEEIDHDHNIKTNVLYYTLPGEELGGLVRKVTIKNLDSKAKQIEVLDGMPAIVPFGVSLGTMKAMGQTAKAWMQVEDVAKAMPYFRVRVSMEDTADVKEIEGGYFYIVLGEDGERLPVIVDPEVVFEYDTAMTNAVGLKKSDLEGLFAKKQVEQNNLPCAFFGKKICLEPNEEVTFYEVVGQVAKKSILTKFADKCTGKQYFEEKYLEAVELTDDLCKGIYTKTASSIFDAYCNQTYLDNILRGGYPVILGKDKIFYLYSRKHGDVERDYNFFSMLPEYYSQGNANFRDVNQNRRCDVLFNPYVKEHNIKTFYNLIQTDGYNPLAVQKTTYSVDQKDIDGLLHLVDEKNQNKFAELLKGSFTPGSLLAFITKNNIDLQISMQELVDTVVGLAKDNVNADFGEGYWSDHWTYNLDLIESYLMVYPDKEKELLFEDDTYTYFESKAIVMPRKDRYVVAKNGIRQYHAIDKATKKNVEHKQVRSQYGEGDIFTSSLMAKLILLGVTKMAALDSYGMGIEMEGGKPGWYDALNGLPGIFGSSMCETYELCRMLQFTVNKLTKYKEEVVLPEELIKLLKQVSESVMESGYGRNGDEAVFTCWNKVNDAKEAYRAITTFGYDGSTGRMTAEELITHFEGFLTYVQAGITKAIAYGEGISPAYFTYEVTDYIIENDKVIVKAFQVNVMPHFLEGPVRYLKLANQDEIKKVMYDKVKSSNLFDSKLKMYKVNESLKKASFEVGRAKAFTPGWLENESIWLHMEYKYLLEVLKSGLYEEFFEDFEKQCIPFIDTDTYGRSPLENSSFIASSANPNEKIHGKGFVARLSGATAEFVNMWQIMMFGKQPFLLTNHGLELSFAPIIPKYLIGTQKEVIGTFLGEIRVEYHINKEAALIPGQYHILQMTITYKDGTIKLVKDDKFSGEDAYAVRDGKVSAISVEIEM